MNQRIRYSTTFQPYVYAYLPDTVISLISLVVCSFVIYIGMHDILIFWSIVYAIISYLGLGFSAVCSKWLSYGEHHDSV